MQTLRDLKIAYIDEHMSKPEPLLSKLYLYREQFMTNNADLVIDICERMESDYKELFFDEWIDKCYDYVISKIDWDLLYQCETCHKFFDEQDYPPLMHPDNKRFCSAICEEDYEEVPDRGER